MTEWITTASRQLRVSVLVEARYLMQPQPADAIAAFHAAGHDVDLVVADRHVADLAAHADVDVMLARGRSPVLVSLLRAAEAAGIPVANPAAAVSAVVDKAGMGAALAAAGVPVPRTWVGPVDGLTRWADLEFPLVLKPVFGDNARGLVVVRSRAELTTVPWPEPVALVQTFHRGDGVDLKLYVVGDRVWAVRRPSPVDAAGALRSVTTAGDPVPVTPLLAELALRCGQVFGLRIYGVDCVDGADGPLVVEVNDFPNYRGAVGASEAIADLVADLALIPADVP
jgi:ribosomal protein S6--L-glutamate ligase